MSMLSILGLNDEQATAAEEDTPLVDLAAFTEAL